MPEVQLSAGPIAYADTGGSGPTVLLVGGLAIGPSLWDGVVADLRADHRCVVPTLPWGAHRTPMHPDADLTLRGHARLLAELIEALRLRDVTLVENDTGMAQLLAAERPELLARLVLCSCEAFDNYPPGLPGRAIALAARLPGGLQLALAPLRIRALRRSPLGFGLMTRRPIPHATTDAWLEPLFTQPAIRRDLAKYVTNLDRRVLVEAADGLRRFDRPALVLWAAEDRVMPPEHGRRLAALLPQGEHVEVADSRTLVPLDQPAVLAAHVRRFVAATPRARGGVVAPTGAA